MFKLLDRFHENILKFIELSNKFGNYKFQAEINHILRFLVFGDTSLDYFLDEVSERVGLAMCPARLRDRIPPHRTNLSGEQEIDTLPS